jgi:hypothetical protein
MNTELLSPELQLNNMLEQINAQLPDNKAQKVSEIMNTVLGGTMLLRHIGFGNAVSKLGSKISDTVSNLTSGEGTLPERLISNLVPESLQPAARTILSAAQNPEAAVNELVQQGQQVVTEAAQQGQRVVQQAQQAVTDAAQQGQEAVNNVVQQGQQAVTDAAQQGQRVVQQAQQAVSEGEQAVSEVAEQAPGFLDRLVSGIRNLGSRARQTLNDDPFDLDNPALNLDAPLMADFSNPFSEGPLNIDMASRRGLFRLAPESGESDSGQNLGNVFNDAMRNTDTLPDLPIFDGMRTVPQASQLQQQQASANRAFDTRPETEQQPPASEQPAPEQPAPERPAPEQPTPNTQESEQATGEENLAPTINTTEEAGEATEGLVSRATAAVSRTAATGEELAAGASDLELGPIFEGAALLGSIIPQLVSAFEKPEEITPSFVGEQSGL